MKLLSHYFKETPPKNVTHVTMQRHNIMNAHFSQLQEASAPLLREN